MVIDSQFCQAFLEARGSESQFCQAFLEARGSESQFVKLVWKLWGSECQFLKLVWKLWEVSIMSLSSLLEAMGMLKVASRRYIIVLSEKAGTKRDRLYFCSTRDLCNTSRYLSHPHSAQYKPFSFFLSFFLSSFANNTKLSLIFS
jgi:hypothetical protein